ncbi:FecR family protein [Pedobacter psychrotolerans]|uniref:FecR family protein n=1 Tax=Pedobacter psychrotolerans TaxID=1843235 RepID=A0A4R2HP63_9SPHI|nr:FecR family protein [Pedobacter psychrotolerans]TCO31164.1 FecR family protein [Pedobacter psychrotolerans]GGE41789.1 hypothetical protein GCM10011413_04530 [Pedobacter psychrotolerans]
MDFSQYIHYTYEDFFNDDAFLLFIVEQKTSDMDAWETFLQEQPYRSKVALAAFETISAYRQQKVFTNEASQAIVFDKITATLTSTQTKLKSFNFQPFFRVAAVLAVVALSAVLYFNYWNKKSIETDFGHIQTLTLPDGSEVTLNGNSKISYAKNFKEGAREIWLNGEALFKVKHINIDTNNIKPSEKFIVHCSDMDIEVLGTTFNVKSRHNQTSVGLLSGKIKIDYDDVSKKQKAFIMAPGDFVKYARQSKLIHQKIINPQHLTAWTTRHLVFQDASLEEMIAVLQDDLGYEVILPEDELNHLKLEGEINVSSVKELLQILSNTLYLTIKTENKKITITK